MPQALLDHVRYPEGLFDIQAEVWSTYHVDGPEILYNKGDQWQIPDNVALSGPGPMEAYYVIMRLPGEAKEEFLLMLPFVPERPPEHDHLARRAQRRAGVRQGAQLHLLQEHDGVRPEPGRGGHQPGSGDLARSARCGASRARR